MALLLGVDIGSRTIKTSIFDGSFGRYKLQGFRSARVPEDDRPLAIRQQNALLELLRTINQTQSISGVIGFPCKDLSTRKVTVPFTDKLKINQILPYQIEDQIPFDIDDVKLAHRTLSSTQKETNEIRRPFGLEPVAEGSFQRKCGRPCGLQPKGNPRMPEQQLRPEA